MFLRHLYHFSLLIILLLFLSCDSKVPEQQNRIVIGISADVQTFNPLFAMSVDEGAITELLYLGLFDFRWNDEKGEPETHPMVAKSWEWADDSSSIKFFLREDVFWTDGEKLTANDVVFSFDVYSDPEVQSRLYGTFKNLFVDNENHIDVAKTFEIISAFEFKINFPSDAVPNLYELSFSILPEHIFGKAERKELVNSDYNFKPVSSGSYKLKKWDKNQAITLTANNKWFLYNSDMVRELIFKVAPDYTSRLMQLKKSEIDLVELVKVEDIEDIKQKEELAIVPIVGREYDYIGLNNIDIDSYEKGKIIPNKLFGNKNIRKAISFAVNKKEILEDYMLSYGQLASSPVSPIFKSSINNEIKPYDYDVKKAKQLLSSEGWKDVDNDGILEKGTNEFSFTLFYPAGNPLREYASTVIRNNLKAVGINVNLGTIEQGTFIDYLFQKKLDAWMVGWYIPIPLGLKPYWYSDLQNTPLNFVSYRNSEVDSILDLLETKTSHEEKNELYKNFQAIIHEEEPVSFLYWVPNICIYNKRVTNLIITPLGLITHCWEWRIKR